MGTLGRSQCRRASQTHRNRKKARSGNGGNEPPADPFCLLETGLETRCRCCRGGPPSGSRVLVKPSDTDLGRESPSRTVLYWTVLYCRNQVSLYRVESGLKKGESPGCTKAGTTSSTVHPGADGPPGTPVSTGPRGLAWDEDDQ